MPIPTTVPLSFARALKAEFPYLSLRWSHDRCRWQLWETDERGAEWPDCWIEGQNGEPRDPGDWLLVRLRAATRDAQGIHSQADRRRWIRGLRKQDPFVCWDCGWYADAFDGHHPNMLVDRAHARRCLRCLEREGWEPGLAPHLFKTGYILRASALTDRSRGDRLRDEARWYAHQGRAFSTRGATSVSDTFHAEKKRRERHQVPAQRS